MWFSSAYWHLLGHCLSLHSWYITFWLLKTNVIMLLTAYFDSSAGRCIWLFCLEECHAQCHCRESEQGGRDWEIESKIFACVHDGAANCSHSRWTDFHCTAHKLQLHITGGLGLDKVSNHPMIPLQNAWLQPLDWLSLLPTALSQSGS